MKKYYVYEQQFSNSSMASCYDAYTDNPFLMKEYINQMNNFLRNSGYIGPAIQTGLNEINAENEESLIKLLTRMKIGFSISKEHRLWSISSDFSKTTIITNQAIYSKFIETMILTDELRKIDANIYRLSSPTNLTYITRYMSPDVSEEIINIIKILYEYHRRIKELAEANGGYYRILSNNRKSSDLWYIINESVELSRFIETDILKIFKIFSYPFK